MAALESPHWEAVPSGVRDLLAVFGAFPFCRRFYLGGGTALALRLGHRVSHDLDFFSEADRVGDATRTEILEHVRRSFSEAAIVTDALGDLTMTIADRHVGFYSYGYRMLETGDELLNHRVAGLLDIAAMKLDAIAGRGARRDFYDVYAAMPLKFGQDARAVERDPFRAPQFDQQAVAIQRPNPLGPTTRSSPRASYCPIFRNHLCLL